MKIGQVKDFSGNPFFLPQKDVNTDLIIPAQHLNSVDKDYFGQHCLETVIVQKDERESFYKSQILVGGANFGCGSSREHAPWALEAAGIRCVIAPSFARIFESSMFANALLCITLPQDIIDQIFADKPQTISIAWAFGEIAWHAKSFHFNLSDFQKDLISSGGYVGVIIKMAAKLQAAGELDKVWVC